jgi:hypothetical protein
MTITRTPKTVGKYKGGIERLNTCLPTGVKEALKQHLTANNESLPAWIIRKFQEELATTNNTKTS